MSVRPLNGLVSIAECASQFEADAAVAKLGSAGIDAMVLSDPAASVAPHLVTERRFSVLVRIAIADDAHQVLVRGGPPPGPPGPPGPSPLVHPALRPRPDQPPGPPPIAGPGDPAQRSGPPPIGAGPAGGDALETIDEGSPTGRPTWMRAVAWLMVASVLLPLLVSVLRALGQL